MSANTVDLARGQLTQDRDAARTKLVRALDALDSLVEAVRRDVEKDTRISWWADHSQGLVYSANAIERLLNHVLIWDRSIETLADAERYQKEKEGR